LNVSIPRFHNHWINDAISLSIWITSLNGLMSSILGCSFISKSSHVRYVEIITHRTVQLNYYGGGKELGISARLVRFSIILTDPCERVQAEDQFNRLLHHHSELLALTGTHAARMEPAITHPGGYGLNRRGKGAWVMTTHDGWQNMASLSASSQPRRPITTTSR
jgi:hypothetical protein